MYNYILKTRVFKEVFLKPFLDIEYKLFVLFFKIENFYLTILLLQNCGIFNSGYFLYKNGLFKKTYVFMLLFFLSKFEKSHAGDGIRTLDLCERVFSDLIYSIL